LACCQEAIPLKASTPKVGGTGISSLPCNADNGTNNGNKGSQKRTALTTALTILGLIVGIAGLAGSILPMIPGPPLSFLALILVSCAKNWEPFSTAFLITMACVMVGVSVLDYILPAGAARWYGASKAGFWGSIAGLIMGLFFFSPWGMIPGTIIGAFAGELIAGKKGKSALRAALGTLIGNLLVTALKLLYSGFILFFVVKEML
jgi:uncharacterized protein YqgC (DUF456 family)